MARSVAHSTGTISSNDPFVSLATNTETRFSSFNITLKNGANLSGIVHIPKIDAFTTSTPLLIAIHGATCCAHTWDISLEYTASKYCDLLGTPFIAFHRPNFIRSSGWLVDYATDNPSAPKPRFKQPYGSHMFVEEARWYHEYIFPALWQEFGIPNGCSALVTNSHSMTVPITIIAAGLYCKTLSADRAYPWAGLVVTGWGVEPTQKVLNARNSFETDVWDTKDLPYGHDPALHVGPFTKADKIELMLGPDGLCDQSLQELVWKQNTPFFAQEPENMIGIWLERQEEYLSDVQIPVLYGLGSHDWLWKADRAHVDQFLKGFVNAPRVEGALVQGAPHAIELSRVSDGWWLRVFGWAKEVTSGLEIKKESFPIYE